MIRAIIFDLDGVICSTDEFHYEAWKTLADKLGIYFDRKINERLRGVSRMDSLEIVLERADRTFSDDEKLKLADEKNECYKKLLIKMSPDDLSDEVKNTLLTLRKMGYPMAIGSSSKNTKQILKNIGLEGFFDAVSDGTNISRSKPDPEVFLCAAEYLGEEPSECLVVEDADAGIIAAKRGNMSAAGIGSAEEHKDADFKLESFKDLIEILNDQKGY